MGAAALVVALATATGAAIPTIAGPTDAACFGPPEEVLVTGSAGPAALRLADGRIVRLADVRVPPHPPARDDGHRGAAQAQAHRTAAEGVGAAGGPAVLRPALEAPPQGDRHGRILGDVALKDTAGSLRATLVRGGLAFVDPTDMSGRCLSSLFEAERDAERGGLGVWSAPDTVLSAADGDLAGYAGRYRIVSGTVRNVGETKRTIYLNFGEDYRTDFTALIRRSDAAGWGDGLKDLAGVSVRIRGVMEAWNGGLIRIEHPGQIERLPPAGRPSR